MAPGDDRSVWPCLAFVVSSKFNSQLADILPFRFDRIVSRVRPVALGDVTESAFELRSSVNVQERTRLVRQRRLTMGSPSTA